MFMKGHIRSQGLELRVSTRSQTRTLARAKTTGLVPGRGW